jgi:hypothetical protein
VGQVRRRGGGGDRVELKRGGCGRRRSVRGVRRTAPQEGCGAQVTRERGWRGGAQAPTRFAQGDAAERGPPRPLQGATHAILDVLACRVLPPEPRGPARVRAGRSARARARTVSSCAASHRQRTPSRRKASDAALTVVRELVENAVDSCVSIKEGAAVVVAVKFLDGALPDGRQLLHIGGARDVCVRRMRAHSLPHSGVRIRPTRDHVLAARSPCCCGLRTVSDSGCGIPADRVEELMCNMFSTTKAHVSGDDAAAGAEEEEEIAGTSGKYGIGSKVCVLRGPSVRHAREGRTILVADCDVVFGHGRRRVRSTIYRKYVVLCSSGNALHFGLCCTAARPGPPLGM